MAQVHKVRLVLSWHQEQLETVHELERDGGKGRGRKRDGGERERWRGRWGREREK